MRWSFGDLIAVSVVAFAGVWLIDRGLSAAGLAKWGVNAPNG